jgi:wyosine [tRNA(Phe)-imidazoG37] synthetase (radical SAM superfamily)
MEVGLTKRYMYIFGPVYSRRLGLSLGVNNIPYKLCSYTCIYCQLGRTLRLTIERRRYSNPAQVAREVEEALQETKVDYVTFVPDGEPTLDTALGEDITAVKQLGVKVAVLTNASLLWMKDVEHDVSKADYVSLKIDAGSERTWRIIDRPAPMLEYQKVLKGIIAFAKAYKDTLKITTETMLVRGVNDTREELEKIANIIAEIAPHHAYLMTPTRPPAEPWVQPASNETLEYAKKILEEHGIRTTILAAPEQPPPPKTLGEVIDALYRTLLVHPLPVEAIIRILEANSIPPEKGLQELAARPGVAEVLYQGRKFLTYRPTERKE